MRHLVNAATTLVLVVALAWGTSAPARADARADHAAARRAEEADNYREAVRLYTKAIQSGEFTNKSLSIAYRDRGDSYRQLRLYDKAIADYTTAISIRPKYYQAYNHRGLAYAGKGKYDEAVADFTTAMEIKPNYAIAFFNRGLAYEKNEGHSKD